MPQRLPVFSKRRRMTMTTSLPRRLDFLLHDFVRVSWVTAHAHEIWSPRLQRIARAWPKVELASVAFGARPCALLQLSPEGYMGAAQVAASHQLSVIPLRSPEVNGKAAGPGSKLNIVVGRKPSVTRFIDAWNSKATADIGHWLGYPACCVDAFTALSGPDGWLDATWPIAALTRQPQDPSSTIDLTGDGLINVFWRYLGIRNISHVPCRLDCPTSRDLGERLLEVGSRAGFSDEMQWLRTVLTWPVEWSSLHGIGEVRTPLLKILARTDATAAKLTVRWHSSTYPAEGGRGVQFPYDAGATPGLVTLSKSFQRGLEHAKTLTQIS
jgi:hypothetical protein